MADEKGEGDTSRMEAQAGEEPGPVLTAPDGEGPVLRHGDTIHICPTILDTDGGCFYGDYTVTDRDGNVLGWGEVDGDAGGLDYRFYKLGQPPEQRPDERPT